MQTVKASDHQYMFYLKLKKKMSQEKFRDLRLSNKLEKGFGFPFAD